MISGAVLSIRKASLAEEANPGNGGKSGWPTTTATAVWKPSGSTGAVTVKAPVEVVVVSTSYLPIYPRPLGPAASVVVPPLSPLNSTRTWSPEIEPGNGT